MDILMSKEYMKTIRISTWDRIGRKAREEAVS